jgi:ribosome-associated protein
MSFGERLGDCLASRPLLAPPVIRAPRPRLPTRMQSVSSFLTTVSGHFMSTAEPSEIRLDQFLKRVGLADTGGQAKVLIQMGEVLVNGQIETRRRRKLHPGDVIQVGQFKWLLMPHQGGRIGLDSFLAFLIHSRLLFSDHSSRSASFHGPKLSIDDRLPTERLGAASPRAAGFCGGCRLRACVWSPGGRCSGCRKTASYAITWSTSKEMLRTRYRLEAVWNLRIFWAIKSRS